MNRTNPSDSPRPMSKMTFLTSISIHQVLTSSPQTIIQITSYPVNPHQTPRPRAGPTELITGDMSAFSRLPSGPSPPSSPCLFFFFPVQPWPDPLTRFCDIALVVQLVKVPCADADADADADGHACWMEPASYWDYDDQFLQLHSRRQDQSL